MRIFVFGSNLAGIHGAGAAKVAHEQHGAVWHQGVGRAGNSYAIPTKDRKIDTLSLSHIAPFVTEFVQYARAHLELEFQVTQIGCGLAGFTPEQIAPFFAHAPGNCLFDEAWKPWLPEGTRFWGTH